MEKKLMEEGRYFLKDSIRQVVDFSKTDQNRGIAPPPIEKPYAENARRITLMGPDQLGDIGRIDLRHAIQRRESRRSYSDRPLSLEELSFLLWATQGVKKKLDSGHALRTVPSAGCRHAFETYLCVLNVRGLDQGVYRYLPLEHQLLFEFSEEQLSRKMVNAVFGQPYPARPVRIVTAEPGGGIWRETGYNC